MTTAKPKIFKARKKQRLGRGFSRDELKKAGTNMKEALKLGLPLDARRKTAHDDNVEIVKVVLQKKKAEQKPKKLQKKSKKP